MQIITIGRGKENQIVLPDPTNNISRFHAEIRAYPDGSFTITDKSANGTTVNGRPVFKGQEYYVYRNDQIVFAGAATLDWCLIPEQLRLPQPPPPRPHPSGRASRRTPSVNEPTDFFKDMRHIVDEVSEIGERFQNLRAFFWLLKGGTSEKINDLALRPDLKVADPLQFFVVALGFFVFSVIYPSSAIYEDLKGDGLDDTTKMLLDLDFVLEICLAVLVGTWVLVNAFVTYRAFKLVIDPKKRWKNYLRLSLLFNGMQFLGFSICSLPLIMAMIIVKLNVALQAASFLLGFSSLLFLTMSIWAFIVYIKANKRFWETSFGAALALLFGVGFFWSIVTSGLMLCF